MRVGIVPARRPNSFAPTNILPNEIAIRRSSYRCAWLVGKNLKSSKNPSAPLLALRLCKVDQTARGLPPINYCCASTRKADSLLDSRRQCSAKPSRLSSLPPEQSHPNSFGNCGKRFPYAGYLEG